MDIKPNKKIKKANAKKITKASKPSSKILAKPIPQTESSKTISERADIAERALIEHTKEHISKRIDNLRSVRKLVFLWLFLMTALILAVGFYQYFARNNYTSHVFSKGGTYSEGMVSEINSLNPIFANTEAEKSFSKLAFAQLFTIDTQGGLRRELVENVTESNESKRFVVEIRQNAKWSDGEKLTAKDVKFTVDLMKNTATNYSNSAAWQTVEADILDEYKIQFTLKRSSKNFTYNLNFPILPEHKLGSVSPAKMREDKFSEEPITSGPFKFKLLQKNNKQKTLMLESNDNYFGGNPKLDRFEIRTYSSDENLKKAILSGEISATSGLSLEDFEESQKGLFEESNVTLNAGFFAFLNESDPVLKDISVRKAIRSGTNVDKIREKLGSLEKLDLPILPEFLEGIKYQETKTDVEKAKKMLEEAGWKVGKDGFREKSGTKLSINLTTIKNSKLEIIAQELSAQLKELGIQVIVQIVDLEDKSQNFVQNILQPRAYGILIYEISFGADPDIYAFWHSSQATENGYNFSNYKDAVSDDILSSARNRENDELRKAKYELFLKRWQNNVPAIGIARSQTTYINRKSVKSFDQNNKFVEKNDRYSDVIYWQAKKADVYKTP